MTTIFSAGNDTGYTVLLDNTKDSGLVLRITQKLPMGERREISMCLDAMTANMLASFLEAEAVRAYFRQSGGA